jgi:hypothetical protein
MANCLPMNLFTDIASDSIIDQTGCLHLFEREEGMEGCVGSTHIVCLRQGGDFALTDHKVVDFSELKGSRSVRLITNKLSNRSKQS